LIAGSVTTSSSVSFIDEEWGWAVGAGLEVSLPGAPVKLASQIGYSQGACGYVVSAPAFLDDALAASDGPASSDRLELTDCWQWGLGASIAATSTVSFKIDGAYGDIDHFGTIYDYDYWGIAGLVEWKPVGGLLIGAEIQYSEVNADLNSDGQSLISDTDSWQFTLSFQRDF